MPVAVTPPERTETLIPMIRSMSLAALMALVSAACSRSQTQTPGPAPTSTSVATANAPTESPPEAELQRMSIDDLAGMLDQHQTVAIYDNNSHERYESGHIPTARWVGHDQVTADVLPQDRNARLVFYCANEH